MFAPLEIPQHSARTSLLPLSHPCLEATTNHIHAKEKSSNIFVRAKSTMNHLLADGQNLNVFQPNSVLEEKERIK